jgi:hypothetical protein
MFWANTYHEHLRSLWSGEKTLNLKTRHGYL